MRTRSFPLFALLASLILPACGSDDTSSGSKPAADAGSDVADDTAPEAGDDAPTDTSPDTHGDVTADAPVDAPDPRFDAIATALEKERKELGAPGVALAILEGGEVTYAAGFGSKDPGADDPVLASTLFRIGSVTKVLTATAVLQLVESGDVDLMDPITTYLPSLSFEKDPAWAPSIEVGHLLTHQSAIVDYLEVDSSPASDADLASVMLGPFPKEAYLMAPAGRMYNYSNPGYMYAGLVAEVAGGELYRTLMHDRVFAPLGMDRTFFLPSEVVADGDFAFGKTVHWKTGEPLVAGPETYDNAWARPAGYAWSSVLDLANFVRFLRNGENAVLHDSVREEMMKPQVNTEEFLDRMGYGYGLIVQQGVFLGSFYDILIVQHGGAIPGFAADMYWVPACDLGFVTLANTDGAYFIDTLVTALTTLCTLPSPSTPPDLTVDPSSFGALVGTYEDPYNVGTVVVTQDGDDLKVEMPLLDTMQIPYEPVLEPTLPNNFLLGVQGITLPVTFLRDAQGDGEYFRTRSFVAARGSGDAGTSPAPLARSLDRSELVARLKRTTWTPGLVPGRR